MFEVILALRELRGSNRVGSGALLAQRPFNPRHGLKSVPSCRMVRDKCLSLELEGSIISDAYEQERKLISREAKPF